MWPFSKKVSIIKKSYVIGDKLFFKKPLVHPATQELIGFGTIQDISKNEILLYLADGCDTGENSYCQSWLKSFKKEELENIILNKQW